RVRDEAADRSAQVGLHVLVVVPGERRHAVTVGEAELVTERERGLLRPSGEIGIGVRVPALVGQPARYRLVAEQLPAARQDRPDVQLVVHRQTLHLNPCMSPSVAVEQMGSYLRAKLGRGRLPGLNPERTLVETVEHVLPREPDAAVYLDRPLAGGNGCVGAECLGGGSRDRRAL